jgi:hypothetical protein
MMTTDGSFTKGTGCTEATLISMGAMTAMVAAKVMMKDMAKDTAMVMATDTIGTS